MFSSLTSGEERLAVLLANMKLGRHRCAGLLLYKEKSETMLALGVWKLNKIKENYQTCETCSPENLFGEEKK